MATRDEVLGSKYLKSDDFVGKQITVTISHAQFEEMGQKKDRKLVVYFLGKEKGIGLNKTNSTFMFDNFGDDSDDWNGQRVTFFVEKKHFEGRMVNGFSFKLPLAASDMKPAQRRPDPISSGRPLPIDDDFPGDRPLDDDIPEFAR